MKRREILRHWPSDFPRPAPATLWRWLERAQQLGLVRRDGLGSKTFPFRYWLPDREKNEILMALNQASQLAEHYHQILTSQGHFPPFYDVPREERAQAQLQAARRVFGESFPPEDVKKVIGAAGIIPDNEPEPAPAAPAPVPEPEPPEPAPAPEPPVVLPYPWNMVEPAAVPQSVWEQVRKEAANKAYSDLWGG
jgi:hypothetical protein